MDKSCTKAPKVAQICAKVAQKPQKLRKCTVTWLENTGKALKVAAKRFKVAPTYTECPNMNQNCKTPEN